MTTKHEAMRPGEVMSELGISRRTLRDYRRRGLLPCFALPGGHFRYDPEGVERMKLQQDSPALALARKHGIC